MQLGRPSSKQQCRQSLSKSDQLDRSVWTWNMLCTPNSLSFYVSLCLYLSLSVDLVMWDNLHGYGDWTSKIFGPYCSDVANQCVPFFAKLFVRGRKCKFATTLLISLYSFRLSLSLRWRRGMEVVKGLVGSVGYWSGVSSETERLGENSVWSAELKVPPQALVLTLSPLSFLFSYPSFPFSDAFLYRPVFTFFNCTFSLSHSSPALDRNHYQLLSAFSTLCASVFLLVCLVKRLCLSVSVLFSISHGMI